MPLFGRSHRTPEFVMTDAGWRSFDDVIAEAWEQIAATAWDGYQSLGRGLVIVKFAPPKIDYHNMARAENWLDPGKRTEAFRRHCSRYKPDREVFALERVMDLVGLGDGR
jgi:hypothetical protein